jgi:hypothetical protein
VSRPQETLQRLCSFAGIEFDASLAGRTAAPLPLSRYTQTPPGAGKWRAHAEAIERVMPRVEATWKRLLALGDQSPKR